jgi:hypothetical protein
MKENEKPSVPIAIVPRPQPPKENEPKAGEMVEQAFTAAVYATVANNEKVQSDIAEGAEKVIQNKTSAIKAQAELEAKEAFFKNKKNACECFGFNETTTEKWAVSVMAIWHNIATALWIIVGMFTFAPIIFFVKKVNVLIKKAWLAVTVAIIIYLLVTTSPFWVRIIATINGGA